MWVGGAEAKLRLVGVGSVVDFMRSVLLLNRKLVAAGESPFCGDVLQAMMTESCDMVFGPDEGYGA
jgi:hypothetical protein